MLFLLSLVLISITNFSQDIEVSEDLEKDLNQIPKFLEVPNNGVIVEYPTVDKKGKGVKVKYSYKFYNKNLENKWNFLDLFTLNFSARDYQFYRAGGKDSERDITIDPLGKYLIGHIKNSNEIFRIRIEDGVESITTLKTTIELESFVVDAFTDEEYFYLLFQSYNLGTKSKKSTVEVLKINLANLDEEYFKLEVPIVGHTIVNAEPRKWEPLGVRNNIVYFIDNYATVDKESKKFYKRLVLLNLDGTVLGDDYLFLGDKVMDDDFLGDIFFNKFNEGMMYTFSGSKNPDGFMMYYSCYDPNMKKLWEKEYPNKLKIGIQKDIPEVGIIKVDEDIIISSYYGRDNFVFEFNSNKNEFNFEIMDNDGVECKIPVKYRLDCSFYQKMCEYDEIKSFLNKDKKSSRGYSDVMPIFMDDRILILKKPYARMSEPEQYFQILLFKF